MSDDKISIVMYDVASDYLRNRVATYLHSHGGTRINLSVFLIKSSMTNALLELKKVLSSKYGAGVFSIHTIQVDPESVDTVISLAETYMMQEITAMHNKIQDAIEELRGIKQPKKGRARGQLDRKRYIQRLQEMEVSMRLFGIVGRIDKAIDQCREALVLRDNVRVQAA